MSQVRTYTRRTKSGKRITVRAHSRAGAAKKVAVKHQRMSLRKALGPGWKRKLGGGGGSIAKAKRQAAGGNKKAAKKVRQFNKRRTRALAGKPVGRHKRARMKRR